jgi:hypothetical protein
MAGLCRQTISDVADKSMYHISPHPTNIYNNLRKVEIDDNPELHMAATVKAKVPRSYAST